MSQHFDIIMEFLRGLVQTECFWITPEKWTLSFGETPDAPLIPNTTLVGLKFAKHLNFSFISCVFYILKAKSCWLEIFGINLSDLSDNVNHDADRYKEVQI